PFSLPSRYLDYRMQVLPGGMDRFFSAESRCASVREWALKPRSARIPVHPVLAALASGANMNPRFEPESFNTVGSNPALPGLDYRVQVLPGGMDRFFSATSQSASASE